MKTLAFIAFIAIIASLGSALFHLARTRNGEESNKIAKALTVRIGLSLLLFILIFIAFATGLIQPQGIGARMQQIQIQNTLNHKQ
ncbi:MAG: twin transmembrane helix small protein [Methylococcales bacterium]|nr:twin transmembrane helix small protein [Methylococcales bacterium]